MLGKIFGAATNYLTSPQGAKTAEKLSDAAAPAVEGLVGKVSRNPIKSLIIGAGAALGLYTGGRVVGTADDIVQKTAETTIDLDKDAVLKTNSLEEQRQKQLIDTQITLLRESTMREIEAEREALQGKIGLVNFVDGFFGQALMMGLRAFGFGQFADQLESKANTARDAIALKTEEIDRKVDALNEKVDQILGVESDAWNLLTRDGKQPDVPQQTEDPAVGQGASLSGPDAPDAVLSTAEVATAGGVALAAGAAGAGSAKAATGIAIAKNVSPTKWGIAAAGAAGLTTVAANAFASETEAPTVAPVAEGPLANVASTKVDLEGMGVTPPMTTFFGSASSPDAETEIIRATANGIGRGLAVELPALGAGAIDTVGYGLNKAWEFVAGDDGQDYNWSFYGNTEEFMNNAFDEYVDDFRPDTTAEDILQFGGSLAGGFGAAGVASKAAKGVSVLSTVNDLSKAQKLGVAGVAVTAPMAEAMAEEFPAEAGPTPGQ